MFQYASIIQIGSQQSKQMTKTQITEERVETLAAQQTPKQQYFDPRSPNVNLQRSEILPNKYESSEENIQQQVI